ncbi:UNVERIFIED_CONTAM: hypothetical protein Sindi_0935500, partial [Sesamum indicum]
CAGPHFIFQLDWITPGLMDCWDLFSGLSITRLEAAMVCARSSLGQGRRPNLPGLVRNGLSKILGCNFALDCAAGPHHFNWTPLYTGPLPAALGVLDSGPIFNWAATSKVWYHQLDSIWTGVC